LKWVSEKQGIYVWDYQIKTALRRYYTENGKLKKKAYEQE
jgi:hypothetical protein